MSEVIETPREETGEQEAPPSAMLFEDMVPESQPAPRAGSNEGEAAGPEQGESIEARELKAILEALLFVSHGSVSVERLASVLEGVSKAEVRQALRRLQDDYERSGRSLQIVEVAGGFQLVTKPDYGPWIKRLEKSKPAPKLSRSALESLAIIAYKQPIVRAEIEQIRGVETSGVVRTLLERKLIRMVGRKEEPGRPIMYGTTKQFLQHFGLRDLSELPPLREFKELGEAEQAMLPVGEDPMVVGEAEPSAQDDLPNSLSPEPAHQA